MYHQNKTNNSDSVAVREQGHRTREQRRKQRPKYLLNDYRMYRINFYACN